MCETSLMYCRPCSRMCLLSHAMLPDLKMAGTITIALACCEMLMANCWRITLAKKSQNGPMLLLMSSELAAPAGTRRLILLLLRTRPSPPQVLQGVDSSPCPSHVGHCITCKSKPTTWAPW